ncbi:hypothetical protein LCGC14_2412540 [marine sediment metagenome]|uniref:Uncharacterized protein n=1 Tax=marine sediment metagenome TaxID=412755 RepID=A0A0F9BS30_9ZZZZ
MKTVGPANAKSGETEIAMVFSVDPKALHKALMAGGEDGLGEAISSFISKEYEATWNSLFKTIQDL